MSRLREGRKLLSTRGAARGTFEDVNGCYCTVGALRKVYTGDPDSAPGPLTEALEPNPVRDEYDDDIKRLMQAAGLDEWLLIQDETALYEWSDAQFPPVGFFVNDEEAVRATGRILAVWDRAIADAVADGVLDVEVAE